MISAAVRARYDSALPLVKRIQAHVKDVLLAYCADNQGFAFLERSKSVESLDEKLESGRFASWSDIDDLYAATLIVPTLLDEPAAHAFIRQRFSVVHPKLRGESRKSPLEFRFDSPRFKCRLRAPLGLESEPLYGQLFEIQTRTAFEHAWSVTTHKLAYKAPELDWRTQRVAAQLRAAVEQLDILILAYDELVKRVNPSPDDKTDIQRLVSDAVVRWEQDGLVPAEALPMSRGRLSENVYELFSGMRRSELRGRVEQSIAAVESWLRAPGNAFPRSLSVFQLFLGVCAEESLVTVRPKYTFMVTDECQTLFPLTARLSPKFDMS